MIFTVLYLVFAAFMIVYTTIMLGIPYIILKPLRMHKTWEKYINWYAAWWGRVMLAASGSSVEVIGVENLPRDNVLFVSNHQGNFDIFTILGYIPKPKGFLAKMEINNTPSINFWM